MWAFFRLYNPERKSMLLPILGITFASLALIKLGALTVWVAILALALKLSIAVILLLAGLLGWKHFKTP
jgi:hypothetical protein